MCYHTSPIWDNYCYHSHTQNSETNKIRHAAIIFLHYDEEAVTFRESKKNGNNFDVRVEL